MNELNLNTQANETPLAATPRNTARRDWIQHVGLMAGAVAATGLLARTSLAADVPATNATPTADSSMPMTPPDPNGSQAVPGASIVADVKRNPNNPATVIPKAASKATASDIAILNFALGLEFLEADFYARIVEANNNRPYLPPRVAMAAQKLAEDEAAHVSALLEILNTAKATPVSKPQFQFPANVFISPIAFLDQAATFEVTGTGAYLGAAPKVQSKDVLRFAASIYGIEARHTGLIRYLNGQIIAPTETEIPLSMATVLERVKPYLIS